MERTDEGVRVKRARGVQATAELEPEKCLLRERLAKGVICRSCVGCGWNIDEDKRRRELIRQGRSFEVRDGLLTLVIQRSSGEVKKNGA